MNGIILLTICLVMAFLVYKIIASSRKQEGYKRWKAQNRSVTEEPENSESERKGLSDNTFKFRPSSKRPKYNLAALVWCANLLGVDEKRLQTILKHINAQYSVFWISKRRGGYRTISAPSKELKAIQDTIYHRILSPVNIHPAAIGFRHQRCVADNARPHLGKRYVLKIDIHDFFHSIRSTRVRKTFRAIGYPPNEAKVLTALCCNNYCLPQGAATSPALSNIIAYELDKKLDALATTYGLTYTRYADDLTFSGDSFPKEIVFPLIKKIIREEKFELNHKKTSFMEERDRKIITGVSISSGVKMTIPKARKREIRKNVYFILTKGLAEHQRRIGSTDPVYLKRLIGELCYWQSIEPDNAYVSDSIAALKRLEKGY